MAVTQAIIDAATVDALLMCPTLSPLTGPLLDIIVARAACLIQPAAWRKKQQPALSLLICHFGVKQLEASNSGGTGTAAAGPAAGISMGKLSVSFSGPSLSASDLGFGSTEWGLQYLAMRRSLIIAPITGRVC